MIFISLLLFITNALAQHEVSSEGASGFSAGTTAGMGLGIAVMGPWGGILAGIGGEMSDSQMKARAKNKANQGQGYGVITCSTGNGIFKTGMLPPMWPYVPIWIPNYPDSNVIQQSAELAVSKGDQPNLAAAKTWLSSLPTCEFLCYSDKKTMQSLKSSFPDKASQYQSAYDAALSACTTKTFTSHIMSAASEIKSSCTCKASFPSNPQQTDPPISPLLGNSNQLSSRQAGAEITLEPPKPQENVAPAGETMPSDVAAAEAGKVEENKKKLPEVIKNGGSLANRPVTLTTVGDSVAAGPDTKLSMGQTDVLSRDGVKYNLDPNGGVYGAVGNGKAAAGKAGARGAGSAANGVDRDDKESSLAFNPGTNSDNESAMASADPDDYLGMIGIHDDIFKVISRRYAVKSKQWLDAELKSTAP